MDISSRAYVHKACHTVLEPHAGDRTDQHGSTVRSSPGAMWLFLQHVGDQLQVRKTTKSSSNKKKNDQRSNSTGLTLESEKMVA